VVVACAVLPGGACTARSEGSSVATHAVDAGLSSEPGIRFEQPTLDLKMPFGGRDAREVGVRGRLVPAAHLAVVAVDPPAVEATLVFTEEGRGPRLRLSTTGARVGSVVGQVVVSTGLPEPRQLTLLYSVKVDGNIAVDPTNPIVDLRAPGRAGVTIHVSSRRTDFRLLGARVIDGPFEASVVHADGSPDGSVVVRSAEGQALGESRGYLGKVRILTNDPAEPEKDIPLLAFGPGRGAR